MKRTFTLLLIAASVNSFAQKLDKLTVEKIMRDPKWIGTSPANVHWSDDSKKIYFDWNPDNAVRSTLFSITPADIKPTKVGIDEQRNLAPQRGEWNKKHTLKVYEKNGDIWLSEPKTGRVQQLTSTTDRESNPTFSGDETKVLFIRNDNLYALKLNGGELLQLTSFVRTAAAATAAAPAGRRGQAAGGRQVQ